MAVDQSSLMVMTSPHTFTSTVSSVTMVVGVRLVVEVAGSILLFFLPFHTLHMGIVGMISESFRLLAL